jgi:hypothetical protein
MNRNIAAGVSRLRDHGGIPAGMKQISGVRSWRYFVSSAKAPFQSAGGGFL